MTAISSSIRKIIEAPENWRLYKNRSYKAKIQLADPERVYNVPDRPGVVYNFLEDAYEKVSRGGYVITGTAGEMWPIGEGAVKKYLIDKSLITAEAVEVYTAELDTVYAAVMIPAEIGFTLEVDYGEKALLKGNRPGIAHGGGDYVLVEAKMSEGGYIPDMENGGRIINGAVFDRLYKPYDI